MSTLIVGHEAQSHTQLSLGRPWGGGSYPWARRGGARRAGIAGAVAAVAAAAVVAATMGLALGATDCAPEGHVMSGASEDEVEEERELHLE